MHFIKSTQILYLCIFLLYYQVVHSSPQRVGHWDLRGTEEEDRWPYWLDVWTGRGDGHGAPLTTLHWTFTLIQKENMHGLSPMAHYSLTQASPKPWIVPAPVTEANEVLAVTVDVSLHMYQVSSRGVFSRFVSETLSGGINVLSSPWFTGATLPVISGVFSRFVSETLSGGINVLSSPWFTGATLPVISIVNTLLALFC